MQGAPPAEAERRLRQWAGQEISKLLQMPADGCEEVVEVIFGYDDAGELKEFLGGFCENASWKVERFVEELFEKRHGRPKEPPAAPGGRGAPGRGAGGKDAGGKGAGRGRGEAESARGRGRGGRGPAKDEYPRLQIPMYERDKADKRLIVIDAASGRHPVLTNCLNCGKVVTESEGWGPCLFCGNPLEMGVGRSVLHGDDRGYLGGATKSAQEEEERNRSFERAKETKDRLLNYDRNSKQRTVVYDDATDWYSESINPWLNERQREDAMQKAKQQEQRKQDEKRKIHCSIDIFGRTIVDTSAQVMADMDKKNKQDLHDWTMNVSEQNKLRDFVQNGTKGTGVSVAAAPMAGDSQDLYSRLRASLHGAQRKLQSSEGKWDPHRASPEEDDQASQRKSTRWDASVDSNRVEGEFSESTLGALSKSAEAAPRLLPVDESPCTDEDDSGACISMNQPWASLLIHGFSRTEGRGWKTEHRGRLWIHAAGKAPDKFEVDTLEQTYSSLYESKGVPVPALPSQAGGYPTSAVLGCVDLEQCWSREEYANVLKTNPDMPQEENSCEYIFWCLRPRRLTVPIKMGEDQRIWRLPQGCLPSAQRGLQAVRWPAPSDAAGRLVLPDLPRQEPSRPSASSSATAGGAGAASAAGGAGAARSSAGEAKAAPAAGKAKAAPAAGSAAVASGGGGPARRAAPPCLDLLPAEAPAEILEAITKDTDGLDRDAMVLQSGFVQLVGFVPADVQQRIVDEMRELGISASGFFPEQFDGVKNSPGVLRMHLGRHWNTAAQRYEVDRGNLDGAPAAPLPKLLADMYLEAVKRANREMNSGANKKRKLKPFPEGKAPDAAAVDFFPPSATMQIHQDRRESNESINAGYAVMGICIGDACDFAYGTEAPTDKRKPKSLTLKSGDVVLFGSDSRLLWHGVNRIMPRTAPPCLRMIPGRLSLTVKVL
ncbi:unnamed protein product [Prorocentrum cordatum]|uniref:Alpha-ketoglutarate-dependent dioxygenase AlkB-like domain-containing protein n=1 Tax=Prorocentrum cordatum TaxID=2364126 RepID=A0ABN9W0C1_9DINO|nr:unnamed protein product [Polarella glacialis]